MKLKSLAVATVIVAGGLFAQTTIKAVGMMPGPGDTNSAPNYAALDFWSFHDSTNWISDKGYAPVSFTNLGYSSLGNGYSLAVDTNLPAWLQFNVVEADGTANFSPSIGTVCFWFAPSWSSTNAGGTGPGECGRLFEVGGYTPDSSYGFWSIYVDDVGQNIYFSAQTNDLSSSLTVYVTAPISWTTNYFHFVALTFSPTNTALYLDGGLASSGPGLTVYPGPDVLANGLFIGSDSNGIYQAEGLFNSVTTYGVPMDATTIQEVFTREYGYYMMNPLNTAMFKVSSANFRPSVASSGTTPDVVTGTGNLQSLGVAPVITNANPNIVWITNVTATAASDGTMTIRFAIEGGSTNSNYDVFAGTVLTSPLGKGYWTWQGQGPSCQNYALSGMPRGTVFLVLGTPQDTDGDGLTDAYELLVGKTDPNNPYSNLDSLLDGWEILLGLNPAASNIATQRSNYGYTGADWLNAISGIKTGSVTADNEGNIQTVSQ